MVPFNLLLDDCVFIPKLLSSVLACLWLVVAPVMELMEAVSSNMSPLRVSTTLFIRSIRFDVWYAL